MNFGQMGFLYERYLDRMLFLPFYSAYDNRFHAGHHGISDHPGSAAALEYFGTTQQQQQPPPSHHPPFSHHPPHPAHGMDGRDDVRRLGASSSSSLRGGHFVVDHANYLNEDVVDTRSEAFHDFHRPANAGHAAVSSRYGGGSHAKHVDVPDDFLTRKTLVGWREFFNDFPCCCTFLT